MLHLHRPRMAWLLAIVASFFATQALAQQWSATGLYEQIIASDCRDCGEDVGMLVACTGNGQPAEITINAAASETGRNGEAAPVAINIDGQIFNYEAKTVEFGLIGFTPVFSVAYDDPLIGALQSGRNAIVTFNGGQSVVRLNGSREALEIFKAHCGWTPQGFQQNLERQQASNPGQFTPPSKDAPQNDTGQNDAAQNEAGPSDTGHTDQMSDPDRPSYSHTAMTKTPVKPGTIGLFWYTGDGMGGGSPKILSYAVPETDERAFYATCEQAGDFMEVEIYSEFGNLQAGDIVYLTINHPGGQERYQGHTFIENDEYAGSRFKIIRDRNLWLSMANAPDLTFGNEGYTMARANSVEGKEAFYEFAQSCGQ
ncbi:hypothetical protein [uncultured Cohaesibacter sp.]|uniref:hypothetical protein n=1 Tax=uncultured Cohaesibacter sp. TaxID=1002546 RepID=UPI0029C9378C|nr:hypothetical protein [uncultured Cohaesibacter sp.]